MIKLFFRGRLKADVLIVALAMMVGLMAGLLTRHNGGNALGLIVGVLAAMVAYAVIDLAFWRWSYERFDLFVYSRMEEGRRTTFTKWEDKSYSVPPGLELVIRGRENGKTSVYSRVVDPREAE